MNYQTSCLRLRQITRTSALISHDNCSFFSWSWMNDSKNLNTLVSVWWDGKKVDCVSVITHVEECYLVILNFFIRLNFLTEQWSRQVFTRIRTYELVSLIRKFLLEFPLFDGVWWQEDRNEVAESQKCIDSNANFLFKYTKIRQSLQ